MLEFENNLPVVVGNLLPIRRSDVEELCDKVMVGIDYFLSTILCPGKDVVTRSDTEILKRYIEQMFAGWYAAPYDSMKVFILAPWIESGDVAADYFNIHIRVWETDPDYATITLDLRTQYTNPLMQMFKTKKKYVWYEN